MGTVAFKLNSFIPVKLRSIRGLRFFPEFLPKYSKVLFLSINAVLGIGNDTAMF